MSRILHPPLAPPASLPSDMLELSAVVLELCRGLGFATAGICEAKPSEFEAEYRRWLAEGKHGDMAYLEEQAFNRFDVERELSGCASVLMVAEQYASRGDGVATAGGDEGKVARYARGRDYHMTIKGRLHRLADTLKARWPGYRFRSFADTAPIMEREHAVRAGIGWTGKHTLVINPRLGSYVLLGGLLTTMPLAPTRPARARVGDMVHDGTDCCGTCTRCIDACPTGAITPYSVDARRCISYLTIEHRGDIATELKSKLSDWVYGCDICQEVCPHNSSRSWDTPVSPPHATDRARELATLRFEEVLGWDQDAKAKAVEGTPMRRTKLEQLQRNVRWLGQE